MSIHKHAILYNLLCSSIASISILSKLYSLSCGSIIIPLHGLLIFLFHALFFLPFPSLSFFLSFLFVNYVLFICFINTLQFYAVGFFLTSFLRFLHHAAIGQQNWGHWCYCHGCPIWFWSCKFAIQLLVALHQVINGYCFYCFLV